MIEYKKIIKSRKARAFILNIFSFLPDLFMLKIQYAIKTGRKLNIANPRRFTEKIQWYKMYYRNPLMHECVDKYKVRMFVKRCGLEKILVPLIGKYNSVNEIEWDNLPQSFVIKTTHGGGGLDVMICNDKSKIDYGEVRRKFSITNKKIKNTGGREWAYYGLQPGIVIEELLINKENPSAGINDYKIFCYGGKPQYVIVDIDRYIKHKRNFYDVEWNNLHIGSDCPSADRDIPKPEGFEEMLVVASKLAENFPFVRVDLYNVAGKIYFGELTFYPWSGYVQFTPDKFDFELGSYFKIPQANKTELM